MTAPRLRIAVQKSGRLGDKSLELVEAAGFRVVKGANELFYRVENAPVDLLCWMSAAKGNVRSK